MSGLRPREREIEMLPQTTRSSALSPPFHCFSVIYSSATPPSTSRSLLDYVWFMPEMMHTSPYPAWGNSHSPSIIQIPPFSLSLCVCARASPSSHTLPVSCAAVDAWGRRLCRIEDWDPWKHTGKRNPLLSLQSSFWKRNEYWWNGVWIMDVWS